MFSSRSAVSAVRNVGTPCRSSSATSGSYSAPASTTATHALASSSCSRARRRPIPSGLRQVLAVARPGRQRVQRRRQRHAADEADVDAVRLHHGADHLLVGGVAGHRRQVDRVVHVDHRVDPGLAEDRLAAAPTWPRRRRADRSRPSVSAMATHSKPAFEIGAEPRPVGPLVPQEGEQPHQVVEVRERFGDDDAGGLRQLARHGVVAGDRRRVAGRRLGARRGAPGAVEDDAAAARR